MKHEHLLGKIDGSAKITIEKLILKDYAFEFISYYNLELI